MKRIITSILVVVCLGQCDAFSQEQTDTLRAKDNVMFELPTVSINFGINSLMGDVALNKPASSPISQFGYQLTITQSVTKFLNASFVLYTGNVRGEQMRDSVTNVNFRTTLFSQQLSVEYNFYPLLKPKDDGRQLIRPYVGFGVGLLSFRSKGDLKNSYGVAYNYWSDGSVRAEIEGSIDPSESTILERDFQYETDLRDANLDGLRKYSQLAFTLPINAGIRFQVSKNVGVNAAFTYALNFTDMIDNVSNVSVGSRQSEKGFDNQLYGSIGLSVFLGRTKHSSKPKRFDNLVADASKSASKEKGESESEADTTASKQEQSSTDTTRVASDSTLAQRATIPTLSASDIKFAEVRAKKKDIVQLKTAIDQQLKELEIIKQEIGSQSKIKKAQVQQVKEQMRTANTNIEDVDSLIASKKEENANTETGKKTQKSKIDVNEEITSKEVALSSLAQLTKELKSSLTELRKQEKELAKVEYKLNAFNVIRAKVQLMEKMKSKDGVNSSMTEEDRLKAMDAVLAEIEALEQDSSYDDIIERSEIEQLMARLEIVKLPVVASEPEVTQSSFNGSNGNTAGNTVKSNTSKTDSSKKDASSTTKTSEPSKGGPSSTNGTSSTKPKSGIDQKSGRTMEEIKNAPPKVSGGFHWADVNKNGMISPDEVLHFIDALFEGESEKNVEDIQNLIDYYFEQE
ncbi:MAG: hypothetical protein K9G46_02965 [Flavobacteriales bacterium]|nr:hypothetical protein [Flavobacteriales bacterium]